MKKPGLFLRSSHDQLGVLIHPLGKQVQYLVQTHLKGNQNQATAWTKLRQHSGSPDAGRPPLKDEIMRHLQLGFSLLEVMVTMALLAVLASVGAPHSSRSTKVIALKPASNKYNNYCNLLAIRPLVMVSESVSALSRMAAVKPIPGNKE